MDHVIISVGCGSIAVLSMFPLCQCLKCPSLLITTPAFRFQCVCMICGKMCDDVRTGVMKSFQCVSVISGLTSWGHVKFIDLMIRCSSTTNVNFLIPFNRVKLTFCY